MIKNLLSTRSLTTFICRDRSKNAGDHSDDHAGNSSHRNRNARGSNRFKHGNRPRRDKRCKDIATRCALTEQQIRKKRGADKSGERRGNIHGRSDDTPRPYGYRPRCDQNDIERKRVLAGPIRIGRKLLKADAIRLLGKRGRDGKRLCTRGMLDMRCQRGAEYSEKRAEMAATLAAMEGAGTPASQRLLIMN